MSNNSSEGIIVTNTCFPNGAIRLSESRLNGALHREGAPARVIYAQDGSVTAEYWYEHGKLHRLDGPAVVEYSNKVVTAKLWYRGGVIHRDDGRPAITTFYPSGMLHTANWMEHGLHHRDDGPSHVELSPVGATIKVEFHLRGVKPTPIQYADILTLATRRFASKKPKT